MSLVEAVIIGPGTLLVAASLTFVTGWARRISRARSTEGLLFVLLLLAAVLAVWKLLNILGQPTGGSLVGIWTIVTSGMIFGLLTGVLYRMFSGVADAVFPYADGLLERSLQLVGLLLAIAIATLAIWAISNMGHPDSAYRPNGVGPFEY